MSLVEYKKPKAVAPLEFFEAVYMNPDLPLGTRLRAATEAAKYVHPRLMAVATYNNEGDFATMLEQRRMARLPKLIEAPKPGEGSKAPCGPSSAEVSAEHMTKSFAPFRRRI